MDAEHLASLRQAATALIATAPAPTVLAALQALLADPAFAWETTPSSHLPVAAITPAAVRAPPSAPSPTPRVRRQPAAAAPPAVDAAWETLRAGVKAAMGERDVSYAEVAAAISRSEIATRIALNSRKPARPIVRARLQEWLDQAPAVAAPLPFPGPTERRGNGHDAGGAYSSTAG